jgi:hypothetical protein
MIITKGEARQIGDGCVKKLEASIGLQLVLLDQQTLERDFGWVFFYDSRLRLETGEFRHNLAGNAPIVVTKADGKLHVTGRRTP